MYPDSLRQSAEERYKGIDVVKAVLSDDMRSLTLMLEFERKIGDADIKNISEELLEHYMLEKIYISQKGQDDESTPDMSEQDAETLVASFEAKCPTCKGILKGSRIKAEDGVLKVELSHGGHGALVRGQAAEILSQLYSETFGSTPLEVEFCGKLVADSEDSLSARRRIETTIEAQKEREQSVAGAISSLILYGRQIKGKPERIDDITIDSGRVIIEGEVLGVEASPSRDGRSWRVFFPVTDYSSTIMVKVFAADEKPQSLIDKLKKGSFVKVKGDARFDKYDSEVNIFARDIVMSSAYIREDMAEQKRVELHLHTNMSALDGITHIGDYVKRAAAWGHKAIALTDHGVIQSYPDAYSASKKHGVKIIYGIESYFVDDGDPSAGGASLDGEFVVFDLETTGFSAQNDRITEIGAVRIKDGKLLDSFGTFVNPEKKIPAEITKITGITDEMVADAPLEREAVSALLDFAGDATLVAHNANFDLSFIRAVAARHNLPRAKDGIDTVALARRALPTLKNHKLDTLASYFSLAFNHHRAEEDARVTAQIFLYLLEMGREKGAENTGDLDTVFGDRTDIKKARTNHQIVLVKTQEGLKNLFKLVSASNLKYFGKTPRIPKSELIKHREGLIVGSACEAGDLFAAILDGKADEEIEKIASFYDYLEIQPISNNRFLVDNGKVANNEGLKDLNRKIVDLGERLGIPVVATTDAHFLDAKDEIFRTILLAGQGFSDADKPLPLYYRTTDEMLAEFSYLGEQKAFEVVVTNTNLIADMCETVIPIKDKMYPPHIEGADENLRKISYEKAVEIYGSPLPEVVEARLERELNPIINNGFAVMYMTARELVQKSISDGYLVGSRGSVGSSIVAYLSGITEVNSLPPHYICAYCKHTEFDLSGEFEAGCDMPDTPCPKCGAERIRDGFDIPFETFLGFEGEKVPDIDLNFSGVYQPRAHKYTEELFGATQVFRAGTIATVGDKNAYGYVKRYNEERGIMKPKAEENRLIAGFTGVKRTTGQHPGGIMVVPSGMDIEDFTPVQHPADKSEKDIITTHFDYHAIHDNILKLDLLGHDAPTILRMLTDISGIDVTTLPLTDPKVMSLFSSTEALGELACDIGGNGAIALPEFGTRFVRGMLDSTKPSTYGELVRISGLSHGTDVWLGNAETLIKEGTATLKECICIRDDIMLYLMRKGLPPADSFAITESVRKGKGLKPQWEELMRKNDVPEWYITSCKKIAYMFPKAHAVAYVMSAIRMAWFKVYRPLDFYATYFSARVDDFDAETLLGGLTAVQKIMNSIKKKDATAKEEKKLAIAEVVQEMNARGYEFLPVDIYVSSARNFTVENGKIRAPLCSLPGLGTNAAESIVMKRTGETFLSQEEFISRCAVSKSVAEVLSRNGALGEMPESAQLSLF